MPSARRSGRLTGPRAVYTNDPFESAGISEDSGSEEVQKSATKKGKRRRDEDSASDDEFVAGGANDAEEDEDEEEEEEEEVEEGKEDHDDVDEMDIDEPRATPRTPKTPGRRKANSRPKTVQNQQNLRDDGGAANRNTKVSADETRSRGVVDPKENVSKPMHYITTFGDDDRDLLAAIYTRDRWARGVDTCLPTRNALDVQTKAHDYEYGPTWGASPEDMERERTSGWDWYYDKDTGKRFQNLQKTGPKLKEADARRKYLPRSNKGKHTILMGPVNNQQVFHLGQHESFNFGEAWGETKAQKSDQNSANVREGWMISFEQRIQCLAWAPNQNGRSQYLAVVTFITTDQKKKYNLPGTNPPSSFCPLPSYPCALQLWEFTAKPAGGVTHTLDMDVKPHLRLALCTDWGDVRRIAWCPMARERREEDDKNGMASIGLLAGIWGDGKMRVLDVKLAPGKKTEFVKIEMPVFEAKSPSNVCSCLTWLSPTDIAVGCSDGFVAIWSILPTSDPAPIPYFYKPIHASYILSITSAYPTNPHIISTVGMDGETKLWSIIDPASEYTTPVRQRQAAAHISYSPILQSMFSYDENDFGRLMPIRRFFATTSAGRMPSSVISLAPCSFLHPCLLYGTASGEAVAANPFRRLLYNKEQHWQQTWFSHDWASGTHKDSSGASRFYDGYRAETQSLARSLAGDKRPQLGSSLTTIYDERTHVSALGWSPNRLTAGWACAGLGCGLLRVEDLAI
ncbi:uncharacterized protein N7482_003509 [Penicillium canariense]|uniref:Transcription factor TFIIIC complex subunit Tfc6 n=1 Tax=Penicillium canariense TaxID=189055 RepID=A0A9W9I7B8_9EURO|nr:uncharacterized protein N7482_003509 [Penicillium canariense]KAJ5167915.1 hypothetical protein N7482_003509 [Penicillium canariense]